MYLSTLQLANFKNYAELNLDFSARLNCLTGLNGMGKTNILDAIHLLCLLKSPSGLTDKQLVRFGELFFRVDGRFVHEKLVQKITIKYQQNQRKILERNAAPIDRFTDYIGTHPVVMIAPDDVALAQEGSEDRRKFLDASLSQISSEYLDNLLTYNALIKNRNALLKTFAEQKRFDKVYLEAIDVQLPKPAKLIFEQRTTFIEQLLPIFQDYYQVISGGRETVGLQYESDLEKGDFPTLLTAAIDKDRILQRSTVGIHRDDLSMTINAVAVKKFASQGQLKSYLLALRLAQYEILRQSKSVNPILLLDDIYDKLDTHRVRHLIGLLVDRSFGQIFITDTNTERMNSIIAPFSNDYSIFSVENATVSQINTSS